MKLLSRLLLIFSFVLPSLLQAAPAPVILVLGDSLSAAYGIDTAKGWVALLAERLRAQGLPQQVVNASISGDTSKGGLDRLPPLLAEHRPQLLIVELGANDGLRGLSLAAMRANLTGIIELAQRSGARVLLLGMRIPPNYGPRYTEQFHAIYAELAAQYHTGLVDFFLDGVGGIPSLIQDDGLHPNETAQPRLLDNIWASLRQALQPPG